MIKKKSFTLQAPETKVGGWAKFLEWNRKWNKIMAGVFCVLVFALLFAAVVVNTTTNSSKQLNTRNGNLNKFLNICELIPNHSSSKGFMCDILCSYVEAESLSARVEAEIENDVSECSSIGYHLRYDVPLVQVITPGWFTSNKTITKITIRDKGKHGQLAEIQPGAFNDCTFRKMTELVIRWTVISVLREGIFEGASSLKKLSLEENDSMYMIESFALDPLYQLEEITMINQPRFESLLNFTGHTQLKHVHKLTFNSNNFTSSIDAETFKGCSVVESIDLSNSSIETIGVGAFDYMAETIRFLDLKNNKLKHLPSRLLTPLFRPDVQIYLSSNPWHCDCDSMELQSWSTSALGVIADYPLMCHMPEMKHLSDVDLSSCEVSSELTADYDATTASHFSTEPSSPPTTKTTTLQPPFSEPLDCVNEKYTSGTLYLGTVYQYFSVKQVEMGTVSVEISAPDASLSMVVINDNDDIECRYDVIRQMTFNNLDPNVAHLFCLIRKTSDATSPRNCYPFHFDNTTSIWSHDEIIIALICSIVLSLVVGLLCGWLLSCRYQRVFKAKESLQYRTSARPSSKTGTEIEDFSSSITSDYFTGRYGSVKDANAKRLRRTYSDNSIASRRSSSYIKAVTPSPFDILQWKLRKNAIQSNDLYLRDYLDKVEYDCLPPPLPPHPNRRHSDKIYETIAGEPVYICTSEIDPYKITYAPIQVASVNVNK